MRVVEHTSKFKQRIIGLCLLIFSSYCVNSTMFYHQHIVGGETITHSHFHSDLHTESSEDGGHSLEIIKLIAVLGNFVVEQQSFDSAATSVERPLEGVLAIEQTFAAQSAVVHLYLLRAPPVEVLA
ncbi:MAG: hypothetical protein SNI45_03730 [Rikenellaceae bacterium]